MFVIRRVQSDRSLFWIISIPTLMDARNLSLGIEIKGPKRSSAGIMNYFEYVAPKLVKSCNPFLDTASHALDSHEPIRMHLGTKRQRPLLPHDASPFLVARPSPVALIFFNSVHLSIFPLGSYRSYGYPTPIPWCSLDLERWHLLRLRGPPFHRGQGPKAWGR